MSSDWKLRALKRIGADTLPAKVPICINHDATLAVYSGADGYELWRVNEGELLGNITRGSSEFSGLGRPLLRFVGNGNVLAISDGTHLRLFSGFAAIPSGQEPAVLEHQLRPSDPVSPRADFVPVFLSSHMDTLMHFGTFTTYIPDRGPHGPWMQRFTIRFPGDEGERHLHHSSNPNHRCSRLTNGHPGHLDRHINVNSMRSRLGTNTQCRFLVVFVMGRWNFAVDFSTNRNHSTLSASMVRHRRS